MQAADKTDADSSSLKLLAVLGWTICILLVLASWLWDRTGGQNLRARPILLVLGIYLTTFLVAGFAFGILLRSKRPNRMVPIVIVFGLAFRFIQLFSTPFLEIDIYRYMWDGIVVSHGVSPYEWSPEQAQSKAKLESLPKGQQAIIELAGSTDARKKIVAKVHFEEYTTIYPPVAQAVFGAAMWCVPDSASMRTHRTAMKLVLVLFDVGTMFLLLACLRACGRNPLLVSAYAWNPLVIKEIANSGHLDSIAVFFVMGAVLVFVKELRQTRDDCFRFRNAMLTAFLVSCGSGAKLFPTVLVPLFTVWIWRNNRRNAVAFAVTTVVLSAMLLGPVFSSSNADSKNGLKGFLSLWRMNAVAYDVVYENVRSHDGPFEPWYSVVPVSARQSIRALVDRVPGSLAAESKIARILTLALFAMIYLWVLTRPILPDNAALFPQSVLYVLSAFLFLQPTVNPWYWVWVVPFTCFAKNSGWHMVGMGLLIYYSRFWFKYSGSVINFAGTRYENAECFDHIIVWGEYAWFVFGFVVFRLIRKRKVPDLSPEA